MNWSSTPPRISGWWFVGMKRGKALEVSIVEVREKKHRWQWTFMDRDVWLFVDDLETVKWAGPIHSPSLENFNKAK